MALAEETGRDATVGLYVRLIGVLRRIAIPIVPLVIALSAWFAVLAIFDVPSIIFPRPEAVLYSFIDGVTAGFSRTGYWYHAAVTFTQSVIGLLIGATIGITLGVILGTSRLAERAFYPYIVALQGLPKMALAPIFIVWFGFGMESKIALVILVTFFPMLVNTWAGIKSVSQDMVDMARSFNASQRQVFYRITFPSSLPYIFAGLDIAIPYSIVSSIIGEFLGAQRGLGFLLEKMNYDLNMAGLFGVFVFLLIVGYCVNIVLRRVRTKVLFWAHEDKAVTGL